MIKDDSEKVGRDGMSGDEEKHWLVRPATVRWLWRGGLLMLLCLVLADFFVHPHPYFKIDGTFGFFSWYGLVVCAAMVIFAKGLGVFLKRKDTYYDDE